MKKSTLIFVILMVCLCYKVSAQQVTLRGHVYSADNGQPLPGATVFEVGTSNGVSTSVDGSYIIRANEGSTLLFSFVGYQNYEHVVSSAEAQSGTIQLNVTLEGEATGIDDIVVIAYGVRKKGTVAGSVATISGELVNDLPAASLDQVLQGKTTGLTALSNSGEPSAGATLQVRGTNSINSGTAPLIIVDGVAVSQSYLSAISLSDIESTTLLKDASSTSIYGSRAANGVLIVTTKRGKSNEKGRVNFRSQLGFSNLAYGNWEMMNTAERLQYEKEIGIVGDKNIEQLAKTNTNWLKEIFKNNAFLQNHEISVSGGAQRYNYYISGGYYGQEGIAPNSDYKRYNARVNLNAQVTDWLKVGTSTGMTQEDVEQAEQGQYYTNTPISGARFMLPYYSPYNADGSIASVNDGTWLSSGQNPLEYGKYNYGGLRRYKLLSVVYGEVTPIQGLTLRSQAGADYVSSNATSVARPDYKPNGGEGSVSKTNNTSFNLTLTNTATYQFDLNREHFFNILLGHEYIDNDEETFGLMSSGQNNPQMMTLSTGTRVPQWADSSSASAFISFFGRGEYNYKGKYYVDLSLRRDGSSRFGKNNRWANFWSVGAMWDIRKEDFMEQYKWLTNLQLSVSTGTSGNSSIGNYAHQAYIAGGPSYAGIGGLAPTTRGNPDLTWEKLHTTNVGLKMGFINRINLNVEFYNNKTTDMLLSVPVSMVHGESFVIRNVGAIVNRGVEFDLSADIISNKKVNWNVYANASYNKNEITELFNGLKTFEVSNTGTLLQVGHEYGEYYVVRFAGVNPVNGDGLWYTKDGELTNEYNENDKVLIGKSHNAPWTGGFGTSLYYKGFTLGVNFSWVYGRWVMNNDRFYEESNGTFSSMNQSKKLLHRWKEPGDITDIPRHGVTSQFDSRLIEDASFLRLKNVTLSYNLPKSLLEKTKFFESARVFVQGQNLWTITKFSGLDPESTGNLYQAQYPLSRQYTFGLELSF